MQRFSSFSLFSLVLILNAFTIIPSSNYAIPQTKGAPFAIQHSTINIFSFSPLEPTPHPIDHIFPDSEIVYSPTALDFDIIAYLEENPGFMSTYQQYLMITGWNSGAQIIERVALENSINPRLLLALLEYQTGCILGHPEDPDNFDTAMGALDYYRKDLYGQLVWAVHIISEGFYGWMDGSLTEILYPDGTIYRIPTDTNAGTVALHYFFAQLHNHDECLAALDLIEGFPAVYTEMFGDPWVRDAALGTLIPEGLAQPELTLPFEPGRTWAYTGGPHKSFESNGPLAALDFAPKIEASGCTPSNEWIVAMADGLVVRSELGVVIQDLDGDGYEQTGWVVMYLHVGEQDRVPLNTYLKAGERIGHPSCEGGRATGTHLHIARKFNGVWMAAGGPTPFVLDGWTAQVGEAPYLGSLIRGDVTIQAHEFGTRTSLITRESGEQ